MLDEFGRPLRWKDCKEKDLKFAQYFVLLDCYKKIPGAWKHFFLQQNYHHLIKDLRDFPTIFCDSEFKQIHNIMTKQLNHTFLRLNNPEISKVFTRFNELYNMNEQQVSNLFTLPANVTIDSRLRITHFKVLNNLIPTNEWLARIGRKNSSLCSFCNATSETMDHLFFTCPKITAFWNALRKRVTDFNPDYFLTGKIILFGITEPKSQATSAFNFLILLGKQFILCCKYQESIPSL